MIKNFILDTNVVVHSPMAIYMFEDNDVILPLIVLEELDNLKNRDGVVGYQARAAIKEINKAREHGNIRDGIKLPGGGHLRVELDHMEMIDIPDGMDIEKNDNKILTVAQNLHNEYKKQGMKTILVTKDVCLAIKAEGLGIEVQDYTNDKVDIDNLYKGYRKVMMTSDEINQIYNGGYKYRQDKDDPAYPNEFFCIKSVDNDSHECLARYDGELVVPMQYANSNPWGVIPRNREQKCALELLLNDDIPFVSLMGGAGVGKTLLAVAAGLEKVLEQKVYDKIIFVKPVTVAGDPIGFLPGDEKEKLAPFMESFGDAIYALMTDKSKNVTGDKGKLAKNAKRGSEFDEKKPTFSVESFIETYREAGIIEMKTFAFMRGRTLANAFVIVDEAQQITPHLAKLMLTRAGRGSKFVMLGDASDNQIDNIHLDSKSNGLVYVADKMRESKITGHITLEEVERSPLAAVAEDLL